MLPLNLIFVGLVVVLAWILNLSILCALRGLHSPYQVIYGFLSSLCVSNLFLATIDFPPSVLSGIVVSPSVQHVMCVSWTYLDTLLCNTATLHVLGSALDSYLRLRHPANYLSSTSATATCLKLSAPWTLAFLQSTAFMAIARQLSPRLEPSGTCSLPDPNFLILRSVMCFGLPVSVSAILVFLSAKGLHHEGVRMTTRRVSDNYNPQPSSANIQLPQHDTMETIAPSSMEPTIPQLYQHQCPRHGLLSFSLADSSTKVTQLPFIPLNDPLSPDIIPTSSTSLLHQSKSSGNLSHTPPCCVTLPSTLPNMPGSQSMDIIQRLSLTGNSLHPNTSQSQHTTSTPAPTQSTHPNLKSLNPITFQSQRIVVALNLTLCIFSILLWGPFIIGSLIQGVCQPPYCLLPISDQRIVEFKWISYLLCLTYPILFIIIDSEIRTIINR